MDADLAIIHMPFFITCTASVLSLGASAIERYLAVQYEVKYRTELHLNARSSLSPCSMPVVSLLLRKQLKTTRLPFLVNCFQ